MMHKVDEYAVEFIQENYNLRICTMLLISNLPMPE